MTLLLIGFLGSMLAFALIGLASTRAARREVSDYLVAGRSVSPWVAGLSAVATNNSGFMFIGAIGFTYTYGLSAFWLFFAWILGDYCSWRLVHRQLRERSAAQGNNSVIAFLSSDGAHESRALQVTLGALTVVFLTLYAAAQLKAGGKALEALLSWDPAAGVALGAGLVALYSFAGGIRASLWTDVAQSFVMVVATGALVWVCHGALAPLAELPARLAALDPRLLHLTPYDATLGLLPYALGWLLAGFGGAGQPHIIVRAMTLARPEGVTQMRRVYFSWYVLFSALTMLVGLYARLHFTGAAAGGFDRETALPLLASARLAPLWAGLVLAAIFAATMSTADSQVLSCSASLTQDVSPAHRASYAMSKAATLTVVLCAALVARFGPESVFELVTLAWGLMMTTCTPLMLARVRGWRVPPARALGAAAAGLAAMLAWRYGLSLGDAVYEGAVGLAVSLPLTYVARAP